MLSERTIILFSKCLLWKIVLNSLTKCDLDTCWDNKFRLFDSLIYQWDRILDVLMEINP